MYVRSNGVWSEQQKLTASDGARDDDFGYSVSIDGDTAVIGARLDRVQVRLIFFLLRHRIKTHPQQSQVLPQQVDIGGFTFRHTA